MAFPRKNVNVGRLSSWNLKAKSYWPCLLVLELICAPAIFRGNLNRFGAILTTNRFFWSSQFLSRWLPRDFLVRPLADYKRSQSKLRGREPESCRSVVAKEEVMDPFPGSAQEGHPRVETAGSTSATGAEGYVTVWQQYF